MTGAFLFIGSLDALRRAQGRSIGKKPNCWLFETPISLYYSALSEPLGHKCKKPTLSSGLFDFIGSLAVYYSRMASATLPSSQLRFTSEFGMDSGGSTALLPPGKNCLASLT